MFNLRDFILKTIDGMIGQEPDYKVREIALGWFTKGELVQADLESIDLLIEERKTEEIEETITESEENIENVEETENTEEITEPSGSNFEF